MAFRPESRRLGGRRAGRHALALVALFTLMLIWFFAAAILNELISNRLAFYAAVLVLGVVFARALNRLEDVDPGRQRRDARSGRPPVYDGERQDVRALARRLVTLLESARPLPIVGSQVRLSSPDVYDVVARMRFQVEADRARDDGSSQSLGPLLAAAEAVEEAAHLAMPVPLMDEVRLPRVRVEELLRRLRAAGA